MRSKTTPSRSSVTAQTAAVVSLLSRKSVFGTESAMAVTFRPAKKLFPGLRKARPALNAFRSKKNGSSARPAEIL
jgi:hypothetical protein